LGHPTPKAGVTVDIRETARIYLLQVPPIPGQINSIGPTAPLFTRLSGITQNQLLESWGLKARKDGKIIKDTPPGLTSCNSFVANYAGDAGIGIGKPGRSLGQFNLDKKVAGWGKGFAWIPATEGARPKFGDIFEIATTPHQGISLDFEGDTNWNTAEGGQGGSLSGFDIIKRKRLPQSGGAVTHPRGPLRGWVDIDLFANGPPPTTVPGWLLGWWSMPWRGQVFFYFFEASFTVSWTLTRPISPAFAPLRFNDTATLTMDGQTSITLKWKATGSVEKLAQTGTGREMTGMWNGTEPLVATKLF
jgi:hypothetical protein